MPSTSTPNTLGLDFEQLKIKDTQQAQAEEKTSLSDRANSPDAIHPPKEKQAPVATQGETREKKKPYVNTERVKTGGNQRDKLSEEALTERMARMREQNEKIKQRRLDVQADEEAFRKTQESERAKLALIRKVQENVDRTREQNARRKMDKIQSREWDSGKPAGDWKRQTKTTPVPSADPDKEPEASLAAESTSPPQELGGWTRGAPRGGSSQRGPGRGRGRGSSASAAGTAFAHVTKSPAPSNDPPSPSTNPTTTETIGDAS